LYIGVFKYLPYLLLCLSVFSCDNLDVIDSPSRKFKKAMLYVTLCSNVLNKKYICAALGSPCTQDHRTQGLPTSHNKPIAMAKNNICLYRELHEWLWSGARPGFHRVVIGWRLWQGHLSPPRMGVWSFAPRKFLKCDIEILRFLYILTAIKSLVLSAHCWKWK